MIFDTEKCLKIRILQSLTSSLMILVGLTMTYYTYSEKIMALTRTKNLKWNLPSRPLGNVGTRVYPTL